jgi:CheY-like chemotaxis protein
MLEKNFGAVREAVGSLSSFVRATKMSVESVQPVAGKVLGGRPQLASDLVGCLLHKQASPSCGATVLPEITLKVLIVEDDCVLLRLYKTVLAEWAIPPQVAVAGSGVDALLKLGREIPDLLIVDLGMPEMNGFHLLRLLKAIPELSRMSIVVVSGLDAEEISLRGGIPVNVTVLPKPIPFATLREIAYGILARKMA